MNEFLMWGTTGFWPFVGILFFVALFLTSIVKVITLIIRFFMVSINGWPPEHLDVDGDFKHTHSVESDENWGASSN